MTSEIFRFIQFRLPTLKQTCDFWNPQKELKIIFFLPYNLMAKKIIFRRQPSLWLFPSVQICYCYSHRLQNTGRYFSTLLKQKDENFMIFYSGIDCVNFIYSNYNVLKLIFCSSLIRVYSHYLLIKENFCTCAVHCNLQSRSIKMPSC